MNSTFEENARDSNFLVALASDAVRDLEAIWNEIGFSRQKMDEQIKQLVDDVARVYKDKVKKEQESRDTYAADIIKLSAEIDIVANTIQEVTPTVTFEENCGLIQKIHGLNAALSKLKEVKQERIRVLSNLKTELYELCTMMGDPVESAYTDVLSDLSPQRVIKFQDKIKCLTLEKENRRVAILQVMAECLALLNELKIEKESDLDKSIYNRKPLNYSLDTIERLSLRAQELTAEKQRRESMLQELGSQINTLWDRLKIPEDVRSSFFTGVTGIGLDAIVACEEELARLIEMKQQRIGELFMDTKQLIVQLWDEMEYSDEARSYLAHIMELPISVCKDENLFELEAEAQVLQTRLEAMKPLLKYIEKREKIIDERTEYEESLKNPDRLLDRGGGKRDTGRLLREEKLQNRIKKDLPKITEFLKKKIPQWEEENKMTFCYRGVPYLNTMDAVDEAYKLQKEEERADKERKKKKELEHEATWGSASRRASMGDKIKTASFRSTKSAGTPNPKSRTPMSREISNLSRTPSSTFSAANVCALARDHDENAMEKRPSCPSVSSSSCSMPDDD